MTIKSFTITCFTFALSMTSLPAQNFEIYISDAGNFDQPPWQILKFDQNGENGEVFIDDHLAWPQDIFFLEDDDAVLVSNLNSGTISKFNAASGAFIEEFATGIGSPTRMKLGADNLLYVLQWEGNGKVWRYQLDGTFVDEFTATGVNASIGLDWDADGNLYVSSYYGKYIRKFSSTGADLGNFISTNLDGPTNIWFEENGDLMVVDYNGGAVKRFNSNGEFIEVFISGLVRGEGVDFFQDGNIAIGSGGTSSVRIYNADGNYIKDLVPPGTLNLLIPNAVVFRPVTASSVREVYKNVTFVTPTAGTRFQVTHPDSSLPNTTFEVYNAGGTLIQQIHFSDSIYWDASELSAGIYYITSKMQDGSIARQKVVVQK